jgi:hypothetical protein
LVLLALSSLPVIGLGLRKIESHVASDWVALIATIAILLITFWLSQRTRLTPIAVAASLVAITILETNSFDVLVGLAIGLWGTLLLSLLAARTGSTVTEMTRTGGSNHVPTPVKSWSRRVSARFRNQSWALLRARASGAKRTITHKSLSHASIQSKTRSGGLLPPVRFNPKIIALFVALGALGTGAYFSQTEDSVVELSGGIHSYLIEANYGGYGRNCRGIGNNTTLRGGDEVTVYDGDRNLLGTGVLEAGTIVRGQEQVTGDSRRYRGAFVELDADFGSSFREFYCYFSYSVTVKTADVYFVKVGSKRDDRFAGHITHEQAVRANWQFDLHIG